MATATKATKGFKTLTCPLCGACGENQDLSIPLHELELIRCGACDELFKPHQALARAAAEVAAWEKIIKMMEFGRELAAE